METVLKVDKNVGLMDAHRESLSSVSPNIDIFPNLIDRNLT